MKTELLNLDELDRAKRIVNDNGVIAFPTETVFGLGIRYDSFLAYTKLNKLKDRRASKPYTLMLANKHDIDKYALISPQAQKIIDAFIPGPLTLILKVKPQVQLPGLTNDSIGIRIPDHDFALQLLTTIEVPLFVTSANKSGDKPLIKAADVVKQFDNQIDAIFNYDAQGDCASTIIKLIDDQLEVVREGKITIQEIKGVLNKDE